MGDDANKRTKSDEHSQHPPAKLPQIEITIYALVCIGGVYIYGIYLVYNASTAAEIHWNPEHITQGWKFMRRKQDVSSFEWPFWVRLVGRIFPWLIGQVVLGQIMRHFFYEYRRSAFLAYSLFALYHILGGPFVVLITVQCLVVFAVATWLRSVAVIWVVSLAMLSTLNLPVFTEPLSGLFDHNNLDDYYLMVFTTALTNLRYTSFCLESVRSPVEAGAKTRLLPAYTFIDLLFYSLYLSLFFTGPIVTYEKFHKQFHSAVRPWTQAALTRFFVQSLRIAFWAAAVELFLHYFYFSAMLFDLDIAHRLSTFVFSLCAMLAGQLFYVQYLVMFGMPRLLASCDQISAPDGPRCVAYICLYSEMWKYFDRGLYEFLKRYIYVPLGGSARGIARQFLGSFCCFAFIYFWHGIESNLFTWTCLNFLGIVLETATAHLMNTHTAQSIEKQYISANNGRRLRAAVTVPMYGMSFISLYYFFINAETGNYALRRLVLEGSWIYYPTAFMLLYSCIQVAIEVRRWHVHRAKQD